MRHTAQNEEASATGRIEAAAGDRGAPENAPRSERLRRRTRALVLGLAGPSLTALAVAATPQAVRAQNYDRCPSGQYRATETLCCPYSSVPAGGDLCQCVEGTYANQATGQCLPVPNCPEGTYLNVDTVSCQRVPECPEDYAFNEDTGRCEECFLTTACVEELGLPDDCMELQVLRGFRDGALRPSAGGDKLVELYYELAPIVLARLPEDRRSAILRAAYARYILPSALLARFGFSRTAKKIYVAGTLKLLKLFAPEALESRRDRLIDLFGERARRALGPALVGA